MASLYEPFLKAHLYKSLLVIRLNVLYIRALAYRFCIIKLISVLILYYLKLKKIYTNVILSIIHKYTPFRAISIVILRLFPIAQIPILMFA